MPNICASCGTPNQDQNRFCGACGAEVNHPSAAQPTDHIEIADPGAPSAQSTAGVPPTAYTGTANQWSAAPAPAASTVPAFKAADFDIAKILTGDWLGALITAVATIATAFALSAGLLALMHPDNATTKQFLTAAALVTGAAFGGHPVADPPDLAGGITYGIYPLTITFAAYLVAGLLLSRQLRRYQTWGSAGIHAVRAAALLCAGLITLSLTLRGKLNFPSTFGRMAALRHEETSAVGFVPFSGQYQTATLTGAFIGTAILLLIGAVLIAARTTLRGHAEVIRSWLNLPLRAFGVLLVAVTVLGGITALILLATDHSTRNTSTIANYLALLPNMGITALYLGAGAALTADTTSNRQLFSDHASHHLNYYTHQTTAWLWALPAATLLVFAITAYYIARRSNTQHIQADLLRWLVSIAAATPLLTHLAALHSNYHSGKKFHVHVAIGVDPWQAIGLAVAWGFAIAVVLTAVAKARTPNPPSPASFDTAGPDAPSPYPSYASTNADVPPG